MERLDGIIRDYDWGHPRALAELLGHDPPGHAEAEYWLGAHPSAPATLGTDRRPLDRELDRRPGPLLGAAVADRFGGLPFLLKILAAERPLSIQAHPSSAQAEAGFEREDAAGVPRDARHRNYRDPNHKPELICALTPFEAKCGFRELEATRRLLELFGPELAEVAGWLEGPGPDADRLRDVVARLLHLPAAEAAELAGSTVVRAVALATGPDRPGERQPFAAEIEWTARIGRAFPGDVGVVVALLLNHLVLEPGEALFLPAGNLHAYLRGVGVELMANSDNVLRGGLTAKHVDVDELLTVVDWVPRPVPVQSPDSSVHRFDVPVPEFGLTRLDGSAGAIDGTSFEPSGPEIVLVTAGAVTLVTSSGRLELDQGQAAFAGPGDGSYRLVDRALGRTLAWRATVGSIA
jgi:mannose-6-phosphate isomerase